MEWVHPKILLWAGASSTVPKSSIYAVFSGNGILWSTNNRKLCIVLPGVEQAAALAQGTVRHEYMVNMDGVGWRWRGELWNDCVKAAGKGQVWRPGGQLGDYLRSNSSLNHSVIHSLKRYIPRTLQ